MLAGLLTTGKAFKPEKTNKSESLKGGEGGLAPALIYQIVALFSRGLVAVPTFSAETFACMNSKR